MVIRDRFMEQSDEYNMFICRTCGNIAEPPAPKSETVFNLTHRLPYCRFCKSSNNTTSRSVPYPFKLFLQELQAGGVNLKIGL